MTAYLGDDRFGAVRRGRDRFRLTACSLRPVADLWISTPARREAWVCRATPALILRLDVDDGGPVRLRLSSCSRAAVLSRAIGGLDLTGPATVVALRVVCDGLMTYAAGGLRLDMATTATVIASAGPDRRALDDRLCDLAVDLARPGGYETMRGHPGRARRPAAADRHTLRR